MAGLQKRTGLLLEVNEPGSERGVVSVSESSDRNRSVVQSDDHTNPPVKRVTYCCTTFVVQSRFFVFP